MAQQPAGDLKPLRPNQNPAAETPASAAKVASRGQSDKQGEEAAIERTVRHYFDGLQNSDVKSLEMAFHPDAKLYGIWKGKFEALTMPQWYEEFKPQENQAVKRAAVPMRIISIDLTGDAAVVRTELDYPKRVFTDYLSLLKIGGAWKIVNKIYTYKDKQP
jgi:protease I